MRLSGNTCIVDIKIILRSAGMRLRHLFKALYLQKLAFVILGLSAQDLESASDADRGSGFKDHFDSTRPWSGSGLRAVLCCVTVREIQSSSAMHVVCVLCEAHARPH